eukprot:scaffold697_cov320-Prasinococcus_capsulatus_cf.AAC.6
MAIRASVKRTRKERATSSRAPRPRVLHAQDRKASCTRRGGERRVRGVARKVDAARAQLAAHLAVGPALLALPGGDLVQVVGAAADLAVQLLHALAQLHYALNLLVQVGHHPHRVVLLGVLLQRQRDERRKLRPVRPRVDDAGHAPLRRSCAP